MEVKKVGSVELIAYSIGYFILRQVRIKKVCAEDFVELVELGKVWKTELHTRYR